MLFDNLTGIREGKVFVSNSKDVKIETVYQIINDLKTTIKGVEWDIQDLQETISCFIYLYYIKKISRFPLFLQALLKRIHKSLS